MTAKESGPLIVTTHLNQRSVWHLHGDSELVQVSQLSSYLLHFFLPFMPIHIRTALEYRLLLPNFYTLFLCDLYCIDVYYENLNVLSFICFNIFSYI